MNVFYLGPIGTFSHKLANYCYKNDAITPVSSFAEIFRNLNQDENAIGVVPVENSTSSNVHENIDFLFSGGYEIKRESYLKISLNLYGIKGAKLSDIKEVYSHPKALEQCTSFINSNSLNSIPTESTGKALNLIANEENVELGAIGNASEEGELVCLKENIGNENFNLTRFLHIGKKGETNFNELKGNKLSVVFKLPHIEGALSKALSEIARLNVNLSKIESKPIPGSKFEYLFWVDLEMADKNNFDKLLNVLSSNTKDTQIIGRYELGEIIS